MFDLNEFHAHALLANETVGRAAISTDVWEGRLAVTRKGELFCLLASPVEVGFIIFHLRQLFLISTECNYAYKSDRFLEDCEAQGPTSTCIFKQDSEIE